MDRVTADKTRRVFECQCATLASAPEPVVRRVCVRLVLCNYLRLEKKFFERARSFFCVEDTPQCPTPQAQAICSGVFAPPAC